MELEDRVDYLEKSMHKVKEDLNGIGKKVDNEITRREIFENTHEKQENKIETFMDKMLDRFSKIEQAISVNSTKLWAFFVIGGLVISTVTSIVAFLANKVFKG